MLQSDQQRLVSINVYSKSQLNVFNKHVKLIDRKRKKLEEYLNNDYKNKN